MYYASIGILSIFIHLIINFNIIFKGNKNDKIPAYITYRRFLLLVLIFYIADVAWEVLYSLGLKTLNFYETELYFAVMGFSVLFWTQFVIDYLKKKNWFSKILKFAGWIFLFLQLIVLVLNIFIPIAFWFDDDMNYHTEKARNLNISFQFVMFLATSVYMTVAILKSEKKFHHRYRAIEMFGLVMSIFVFLQTLFPLMPFYTIGFLLGTCIIHTFVLEDEREARQEELKQLIKIEQIQEAELGNARHLAFTDPLTGVKSKSAYQEDALCIESRIENHDLNDFGLIIFDVNDLKLTNDTKGHEEGDKIIREAAKIICQTFKHSPVYRIGGDEFTVFLSGQDLISRETLFKNFDSLIEKNLKEGKVVIANGYASYNPEKDSTFSHIFGRADAKMYERKSELKKLASNL